VAPALFKVRSVRTYLCSGGLVSDSAFATQRRRPGAQPAGTGSALDLILASLQARIALGVCAYARVD